MGTIKQRLFPNYFYFRQYEQKGFSKKMKGLHMYSFPRLAHSTS